MKKIVFALAGAALLAAALAGCSNSSDGGAGIGLANGITAAPNGGAPTGGTPEIPDPNAVLINASNLVYIGEVTETIDSVEYKVKKYADVLVDNPYFYTYYKVYYLNGKMRRFYKFEHGIGCDMDYKYDEFVEHECGRDTIIAPGMVALSLNPIIYTYYENGKLESQIHYSHGSFMGKTVYTYYDNGKLKEQTTYNSDGAVSNKTGFTYYDSGKVKEQTTYNSDGAVSNKTGFTYYDSGKVKEQTTYNSNGAVIGYTLYYENGKTKQSDYYTGTTKTSSSVYYENGNTKEQTYYNSNGAVTEYRLNYENGKSKLSVNYNNGAIAYCQFLYESGYYKHYYHYFEGKFYTYPEDKKLTSYSTNSSDYSSCEDYTPEQASAKVEELKNN